MDSNEISDEKVEQFLGITGCTKASEAKHYLEACGNDMTKALNLYFAQQSRATARDNSNSLRPMPANGGPSTSKASASGNGDMDGDNVRAPIAPVSGPIVEQSFQQTYRNRHPHMASTVFNHFADYRNEAEMQFRNFQQLRERLEAEMAEEAEFGGSSSASADDRQRLLEEKERSLRGIFQPPYDLMYSGDWELARMEAEERGYWLLVNIQDPHEFSSQVLNRDVWSNPAVKDVIKSNFLFWQVYHQSADGTRIAAYYKIVKFPAILIIDPRTGEMVKTLRVAEPVSFSDELTTFLEKFPDFASHDSKQIGFGDAQKKANGAEKSNGADESSNIEKSSSTEKPKIEDKSNGTDRKSRKRVIETVLLDSDDEMDVDMPGPSSRIIKPKRTKVEKDVEDIADRIKNGHKITTGDQEAWKKLIGPVSADTKDIAVVMRMPNGDRHNISVPDSTSLNALFAFISGIGYESSDHLLVLLYPKREYDVDSASITLREMNFSRRELVYVEKKYM